MPSLRRAVRAFRPSRLADDVEDSGAQTVRLANIERYQMMASQGVPLFEEREDDFAGREPIGAAG